MAYRLKKSYRKLTPEQRRRGVIFSSQLYGKRIGLGKEHEVFKGDEDADIKIERLKDDKFFVDRMSPYQENIIRR